MATVDTLLVRIQADTKDLKRGLRKVERDVERTTSKASASFKKLGGAFKLIAVGVIVRQAFIAGKAMVNLASDIEEMQGKSKVVFGQFRDGVVKELTAFGDAVGRSTHELEGMASTVQDTFVPMGFARGEAAKLSVEMTKLAVDVASFNNASDTDTMNAFQSALVGNHETVRRFGVVITQATLDQELMTMGIEGGAKAASNAEKVQARLNLITKGVSDAQGDALRTSNSYANSMRGLKAEFSELTGDLGTLFLPMLVKVIAKLKSVTIQVKEFLQSLGVLDTPAATLLKNTREEIIKTTTQMNNLQASIDNIVDGRTKSRQDNQFNRDNIKKYKNEILELKKIEGGILTSLFPSKGSSVPSGDSPTTTSNNSGNTAFQDQLKQVKELTIKTKKLSNLNLELHTAQTGNQPNLAVEYKKQIHLLEVLGQFTELQEEDVKELADAQWYAKYATEAFAESLAEMKRTEDEIAKSAEAGLAIFQNKSDATLLLEEQTKQLSDAMMEGLISFDEYEQALARLTKPIEKITPLMETLQSSVQSMSQNLSNSFADMLVSGKMNLDSLKDVFKGFVKTMLAKAIELFFINQMMNAIFGNVSGYVPLPQMSLGGRASGGNVNSNQPYLVGERGPELFVPSSAGNIMNNSNTKSIGGKNGTVVNQTINVDAGVSQTVRAEMLNLLPIIKQDTLNAVIDGQNRGGSFSKAFA